MMAENERMHSKVLSLQKSKVRSTRNGASSKAIDLNVDVMISPKMKQRANTQRARRKDKHKMTRSKSVHSMKRKKKKKQKQIPFVPSGNINASFCSIDRHRTSRSNKKSKQRINEKYRVKA